MIQNLKMINFRRFEKQEIDFDIGVSYIEGENNAGKTTIFMAIEYALFGTVSGFSSQSQLAPPGKKEFGVEITYIGKDGNKYKLQRIHETPGFAKRNAKGHYTLKIIDEEGERYLLSSDFPNDTEEMLQLKIFDSLGISKRLFNVAINVKQGETANILEGTTSLDIVLGVSAAVIAAKQLNTNALGFEKEITQINAIEASVDALSNEKNQLEQQSINFSEEINTGKKQNEVLSQKLTLIQSLIQTLDPVLMLYKEYQKLTTRWDFIYAKVIEVLERQKNLEKEHGGRKDIEKKKKLELKEKEKLEKIIIDIEGMRTNQLDKLRELEQRLGDINGKIKRREALSPDQDALCEECGAPIDQKKVKKELIEWSATQKEISSRIIDAEEGLNNLEKKIKDTQNQSNLLSTKINNYDNIIQQLQESSKNRKDTTTQFEEIGDKIVDAAVEIFDKVKEYNNIKSKEQDDDQSIEPMKITPPTIPEKEWAFEIDEDQINARYMQEVYNKLLTKEQVLLKDKENNLIVEKRVIENTIQDKENQLKSLDSRKQQLNTQLADLKHRLKILQTKKVAAEKMRITAKIFNNLQTQLRDRAAKVLAERTLTIHQQLSENDEYSHLRVDPKKYMIYVTPRDIGEEVSAHNYQGGGHKLLLGLAFKMAIVTFVTNPPFILLDEPTYGLDPEHKEKLFENIGKITNSQLMLITHQREDKVINGKILKVIKSTENVSTIRREANE